MKNGIIHITGSQSRWAVTKALATMELDQVLNSTEFQKLAKMKYLVTYEIHPHITLGLVELSKKGSENQIRVTEKGQRLCRELVDLDKRLVEE